MSGPQSRCRGVGDVGGTVVTEGEVFLDLPAEGGREVRLPSQPLPSRILSLWCLCPITVAEGLSVLPDLVAVSRKGGLFLGSQPLLYVSAHFS